MTPKIAKMLNYGIWFTGLSTDSGLSPIAHTPANQSFIYFKNGPPNETTNRCQKHSQNNLQRGKVNTYPRGPPDVDCYWSSITLRALQL